MSHTQAQPARDAYLGTMELSNVLGEFLKTRRSQLLPEVAGVTPGGSRRVAGMRREEVAVMADINVDYYARLEQGRERNPSAQVLEALCRALRLDDDEREHLYRLTGNTPADRFEDAIGEVSPELHQLMEGYHHTPAFVLNRTLDILATNALADALYSPFAQVDNLAYMTFLDPAGRTFYTQWERTARNAVANLRAAAGAHSEDPRLRHLVRTLETSEEFATLWRSHAVQGKTHGSKELHHPAVGALTLNYQAFDVRSAPGQQLLIYHAEPNSPSAQALSLLGALGASPE